ncbi:spore protease YyaC [Gorillibacterium sp. sgz500922]|uniref:spore protease YyaC n=1 Tax=Gorillibacterium sp. sgz500922 TaxID=3446694 RepID=UPI003F679FFD
MKPEAKSAKSFSFSPILFSKDESRVAERMAEQLSSCLRLVDADRPVVFICVGTDRSTGDSLGPLIGSRLRRYNFSDIHLYGTLEQPVHAMNLNEIMCAVHRDFQDPFIIGIDACLGQLAHIGSVKLSPGPLRPGAGVNKELPEVGEMHITGIVNVGGFMEYFVLQNTRLSLVMDLAELIAKAIYMSLIHCGRIALFTRTNLYREQASSGME